MRPPSSPPWPELLNRLRAGQLTRVLAFGSSNTERRLAGMHWLDCLDLGLAQAFGRFHRCINAGVGGDTTRELLARFDEDAAFYRPHGVFVTIGGNDSNPVRTLSEGEFTANLHEVVRRFRAMGTRVIFQTYYAVQSDGSEHFVRFSQYMDAVRQVAAETDSGLIDHLARWERMRLRCPDAYLPLMADAFHVCESGNKLLGVDLARAMGVPLAKDMAWADALRLQALMDRLEREDTHAKC